MQFDGAMITLIVIVGLFLIMMRIFTQLFMLAKIPEDKARFQVISLLTTSGYTTAESEVIMSSPGRRRLAMFAMVSGYVFSVVIVALLLNICLEAPTAPLHSFAKAISYVVGFLVVYQFITHMPFFNRFIAKVAYNLNTMFNVNYQTDDNEYSVLGKFGNGELVEINLITLPPVFRDTTLEQIQLRQKYHVQILVIYRGNQTIAHVTGRMNLQRGDKLIAYGSRENLMRLFQLNDSLLQNKGPVVPQD